MEVSEDYLPTVIRALRGFASDTRAYVQTIGSRDPEDLRKRGLAEADECDRIAAELERGA